MTKANAVEIGRRWERALRERGLQSDVWRLDDARAEAWGRVLAQIIEVGAGRTNDIDLIALLAALLDEEDGRGAYTLTVVDGGGAVSGYDDYDALIPPEGIDPGAFPTVEVRVADAELFEGVTTTIAVLAS